MIPAPPALRHFRVHADDHPVRRLEEASFEAAAVAYVEDFMSSPPLDSLRLFVTDIADGGQRCFQLDLETGTVEACT